ncbi:MAG TPA: glycosyltransferase [Candidatus Saccharimonadia bacterium]|nr:glycosyltransferase [Candidatus Saccharimonadia bacterium]
MPDKVRISIIIVEYKSGEHLKTLLSVLPKRAGVEIIVIDNSIDNIGYGAALNKGMQRAKGKYFLLMNPDVVIDEKSINVLASYLDKHAKVGLVGPQLHNSDGSIEQSSAQLPTPLTAAVAFSFLNRLFPNNPISQRFWIKDWKRDSTREVGIISGAVMMVRASAMKELGGFDPKFFLYWEEHDLCNQMQKAGYKIVYLAEAKAKHIQGVSIARSELDTNEIFLKSRRRYFQKYFGVVGMLALETWLTLSEQWRLIFIIVLSLFLRLFALDHSGFIGDLGRDYLQAIGILQGKIIPLLGIPSSIPRFSQGPLNVWFDALSFLLGGVSPYAPPLFAALLTTIGVGVLYALLERRVSKNLAFVAAILLASAPSAILQSRMPFYLFAEPLFVIIYLWRLLALNRRNNRTIFWAVLSFWLLFQWELATLPLLFLLPIAVVRKKISILRAAVIGAIATLIGLLPQIVFDLTHRCAQLCGLFVWSGYRVIATSGFDGRHAISPSTLRSFFTSAAALLQQTVGLHELQLLLVLALSTYGIVVFLKSRRRDDLTFYSIVGSALLFLGIFLHGSPSEAYFPPLLVFMPILNVCAVTSMPRKLRYIVIGILLLSSGINSVEMIRNKFYLESFQTKIEAARWIEKEAGGQTITMKSFDSAAHFETYLDGMQFLLQEDGVKIASNGKLFYVSFEPNPVLPLKATRVAAFGSTTIGETQ